jgi:hypothetical protein
VLDFAGNSLSKWIKNTGAAQCRWMLLNACSDYEGEDVPDVERMVMPNMEGFSEPISFTFPMHELDDQDIQSLAAAVSGTCLEERVNLELNRRTAARNDERCLTEPEIRRYRRESLLEASARLREARQKLPASSPLAEWMGMVGAALGFIAKQEPRRWPRLEA